MNDIDATFAVLADPTRRRVVELLGVSPLRAGEVADRLGVSRPAMSNHLRALRSCGLVDVELSEEDGRARRYRLRAERFSALRGWLSQLEGDWAIQLEAFREHAERGGGGVGVSDSVTTTVEVAVSPEVAFDVFTRDIDAWYRVDRDTLPDITRTTAIRFEPHLGGRLLDVHDLATGEARELGRITAWEPGRRLVFVDNEGTEVEVTFERSGTGTRVTLTHRGLEKLTPKRAAQLRRKGWAALARLYGDHIAPNARPVALAVGLQAIIFVGVLSALSLGVALGGNQVAWIAAGVFAFASAVAVLCFQQRLARRWLPSEWQYRRIWWRVAMLGPLFLMASGLYAVIERGVDPLTLAFPAYLLMLFLANLQEGPARGQSLRSGPGWTERKFGRRRARVLFLLGLFAAIALLTPVMFGLNAIDRRIFPAILAISAAFFLYQALAVRARRRRLGFDPDLYLAVERRVSEEDLRPELLVHHPSEQPEYSGWYVYASEQDQGSSDLVPWSMRDLLDHSPEAADPLREGHGKWRWDRARNAYSPVG